MRTTVRSAVLVALAVAVVLAGPVSANSVTGVDVVAIGDSITSGHGADLPATQSWPAVLADLNHLTVLNKGVGPNTTTQMRERFDADVVANAPQEVIILGGIHDFFQFLPQETTKENIRWMVERALANGIRPYVATLTPGDPFHESTASLNSWIRSYAEQTPGVGLVDFFGAIESPVGSGDCAYLVDIIHPNTLGYSMMGAAAAAILPTRALPIAADSVSTAEDASITVPAPGVLANDTGFGGGGSSAVLVSGTRHGALVLNADGSYVYCPDRDFFGNDTFRYRGYDGAEYSAIASVTVYVEAVRDGPVAVGDAVEIEHDKTHSVAAPGVLSNDLNPDDAALRAAVVTDVSHGTLSLRADGSFTYRPATDYFGQDAFSYTVSDAGGSSAPATVTITVAAAQTKAEATLSCGPSATITYGVRHSLRGRLTSGSLPLSGRRLRLETSVDGATFRPSSVWATTTADGSFTFAVRPGRTTRYRVWFAETATRASAESSPTTVRVRGWVSAPVARSTMLSTTSYRVYGYLKPGPLVGAAPVRVYRWRYVRGAWRSYGYSNALVLSDASAGGRYVTSVRLPYAGMWRLRAYRPPDAQRASAWSSGFTSVTVE